MTETEEVTLGDKTQRGSTGMDSQSTTCSWSDRNRFHLNATLLGVPQPKTLCISTSDDWGGGRQVGHFYIAAYPVVVKTATATSKNIVCHSEDELCATMTNLSGQDYQVQEWLKGFEFYELKYSSGKIEVWREGVSETVTLSNPVYQKIRGVTQRLIGLLITGGHQKFELLVACGKHATYPLEYRLK